MTVFITIGLCDIAKTQKEDYSFIKLNEEQKKGISGVYGNPTKVRRECPFRVRNWKINKLKTENEKLLGVSKQGHSSKRIKDETYPELTVSFSHSVYHSNNENYSKLQQLWLKRPGQNIMVKIHSNQ